MPAPKVEKGSRNVLGTLHREQPLLDTGGERRKCDRFPIVSDVLYEVFVSGGKLESGLGKTVDMSGQGVLFTAQRPLAPGRCVKLTISWPAQLDGRCALKLMAWGRIVRCQGTTVAMEIYRHEFRTLGSRGLTTA